MATTNTNHNHASTALPASLPASLGVVLAFTFVGSMGTGAITNGFSFIATEGLGYARQLNLLLALLLGSTYIVGALLSGRLVKHLSRPETRLNPRSLLAIILIVIAIMCQLPLLAHRLAPNLLELAIWMLILVFSPASGIFWPIVEGYLSGGRSGKSLRSAIGRFNIVWSGALVLSFWMMAPLLKNHPFVILSLIGGLQLMMVALLIKFPSHPPKHLDANHERAPESYVHLLTIFRVLLVASYIVLSALSPLLPIVEDRLGIDVQWKTPIASAWLTSRLFLFILFERWHGWHGRWWTPWTGMGCMLVGFSLCMLSPMFPNMFGNDTSGLILLILGLAIIGVGVAMTYYGALYYAMAVGNAEVDAGGKHEAVIGMGYTLGPVCGLIGFEFSGGSDDAFRFWVISLVSAAVVICMLVGVWMIRKLRRSMLAKAPFNTPSPH